MCSTVTVFSLSVSAYVGAPPIVRSVVSRQASSEGRVRSQTGSTTRNRDQASHAQNTNVRRPAMRGPSPQSNCSHNPGSGIHGRNTRRLPARHALFARDTARRVERSDPVNPIATSLSCTTSARMCPFERSTHSSTLSRNGSIAIGRRTR
jgi:hypothetical protein